MTHRRNVLADSFNCDRSSLANCETCELRNARTAKLANCETHGVRYLHKCERQFNIIIGLASGISCFAVGGCQKQHKEVIKCHLARNLASVNEQINIARCLKSIKILMTDKLERKMASVIEDKNRLRMPKIEIV